MSSMSTSSFQARRPAWESLAPLPPGRLRRRAVGALLHLSAGCLQLAVLLQHRRPMSAPARAASAVQLEFHAEAGAPEGALYADGELVGWLPGVSRL